MARQNLENEELGGAIRAKINDNFVELYDVIDDALDSTDVTYTPDNNLVGSVGQALDNRQKVFDSVAQMQADSSLYIGQKVRTLGYYTVGDGGGCDYEIVASGTSTDDGGSFIDLTGIAGQAEGLFGSVINVKQFGATGDGVADDTDAIQAAINYCSETKERLYIPGGHTYLMTSINTQAPYFVDMFSDPANRAKFLSTVAAVEASARQFEFQSLTDEVAGLTITQNITPNQREIFLADVSNLLVDMVIRISSDELWPYDNRGAYKKGEIHLITEVDAIANSITIADSTRDTYLTTNILNIGAWTPNKLSLENLEFELPEVDPSGGTGGVLFDKTYNAAIKNCKISGANSYGFTNRLCINTSYEKIECARTQSTDTGYGIVDRSSLNTYIKNISTYRLRAAYDSHSTGVHGPNRDAIIDGFFIRGGGVYYPDGATMSNRGLGMHGPSDNVLFTNGYISDVASGVRVRGRNTRVRNVVFGGRITKLFGCTHGTGLDIQSCTYDKSVDSQLEDIVNFGITNDGYNSWDFSLPTIISNNNIIGLKQSCINIVTAGCEVSNLHFNNNTVQSVAGAGNTCYVFYSEGSNRSVYASSVIGNSLSALSGDITMVDSSSARVLLGYSSDNSIIDRALAVDNRSWLIRVNKDDVAKIKTLASEPGQSRLQMLLAGDAGGTKGFQITKESTAKTDWYGTSFPALTTTATPSALTGNTGTDGNVTIGVMDNGDFYLEDRAHTSKTWRVTLLA